MRGFISPRFGDKRLPERFWSKVQVNADTGCWEWTAATNPAGYGKLRMSKPRRLEHAHRLAYETLVHPIRNGLHCDHLCRVRHCVNPAHIEPVTMRENLVRGKPGQEVCAALQRNKTHCPRGHAYSSENTSVRRGSRTCRTCAKVASRRSAAKRRSSRMYAALAASAYQFLLGAVGHARLK